MVLGMIDLKYRQIPLAVTVIGTGAGIGFCILEERGLFSLLLAVLPGLMTLLFARISNETMGYGDGFVLILMGTYLPWEAVVAVGLLAFGIAGMVALVLLVAFHKNRNYQIPFVPFLTIGYILNVFINGGVFT